MNKKLKTILICTVGIVCIYIIGTYLVLSPDIKAEKERKKTELAIIQVMNDTSLSQTERNEKLADLYGFGHDGDIVNKNGLTYYFNNNEVTVYPELDTNNNVEEFNTDIFYNYRFAPPESISEELLQTFYQYCIDKNYKLLYVDDSTVKTNIKDIYVTLSNKEAGISDVITSFEFDPKYVRAQSQIDTTHKSIIKQLLYDFEIDLTEREIDLDHEVSRFAENVAINSEWKLTTDPYAISEQEAGKNRPFTIYRCKDYYTDIYEYEAKKNGLLTNKNNYQTYGDVKIENEEHLELILRDIFQNNFIEAEIKKFREYALMWINQGLDVYSHMNSIEVKTDLFSILYTPTTFNITIPNSSNSPIFFSQYPEINQLISIIATKEKDSNLLEDFNLSNFEKDINNYIATGYFGDSIVFKRTPSSTLKVSINDKRAIEIYIYCLFA